MRQGGSCTQRKEVHVTTTRKRVWFIVGCGFVSFLLAWAYFVLLYPEQKERYEAKKGLRESYLLLQQMCQASFPPSTKRVAPGFLSITGTPGSLSHCTVTFLGRQIEGNLNEVPVKSVADFIAERFLSAKDLVDHAKHLHPNLASALTPLLEPAQNSVLLAFPSKLDGTTDLQECSRRANEAVKGFLRSVDEVFLRAGLTRELPSAKNENGSP